MCEIEVAPKGQTPRDENDEEEQLSDETIHNRQFPQNKPGRVHGMGANITLSHLGITKDSSWARQREQEATINELKGQVSDLQSQVSGIEQMKMQFSFMMTFMKELCDVQGITAPNFPQMVGESSSRSAPPSGSTGHASGMNNHPRN